MEIPLPDGINIDLKKTKERLVEFIRDELLKEGFGKLVLGISGGIDSAVVAHLAAEAIGSENVTGVILPYISSNPENIEDAESIIEKLGLERRFVDITPMVEAYFEKYPTDDKNRKGNKMARERMSILYDISSEIGALVIGTSNRSEIAMGYGTLYGDLACALNPLGNLYKTQIRQLAGYLGISQKIMGKPPSADLWSGQTDEGELGLTYGMLDTFLYYHLDMKYNDKQIEELGFSSQLIERLKNRIASNKFKGRMPVIADLPK
jgi:NAD+ synthase